MRARDSLKQALRDDFVPTLRAAGFKGTYPTWRLHTGDTVAVVTVLAGQYNEGTYGTFEVMMSVVTPAYKEWLEAKYLRHGWKPRKPGREQVWDGIARMTLTPLNPRDGRHDWTIDSVADAQTAARQMTETLNADQLANLLRLTDPAELLTDLTAITNLPLTKFRDNRWHWDTGRPDALIAHAVLLSDHGGPEFDAACERLERWENPDPHLTGLTRHVADAAQWARARAARLAGERKALTS
ncbi:DUF4304 domain-containing protein [Janibacter melonis]|uniref:DUF4304 domain-containing protein n=1 Tax=Janibacter melonis TaxID=262209 RepID=UPI0013D74AD8|nr:DUF4304 domain-containing protein [Janibacter melonis]